MIIRYLKSDIKGPYSRMLYGRQGEKVIVLKNNYNLLLVINERNEKYFVNPEQLSDMPVKNEEDELPTMHRASANRNARNKHAIRNRKNM